MPWALALDDALSKPLAEQRYRPHVGATESADAQALAELGEPPLPALSYEPSPAVVYVAMDGITLQPECSPGNSSHSAQRCTSLIQQEVSFPAFGDGAATEYQQLLSYFEPFDVVFTTEPPPEFQPYTLAVIGGSSSLIGAQSCGRSSVACDGLKRNEVSITFTETEGCQTVAEVAAQGIAHNWGLENSDYPTDLLYEFYNDGFRIFVDGCVNLSHDEGEVAHCGDVHQMLCPAGGGEQQNSYQELMGVVGPRSPDVVPPQIVSTFPPNGAEVGTDEDFTITAKIEDNSRMVGVRWTWLKGMPQELGSFTRCTNEVCDEDFNPGPSFVPGDIQWNFIAFSQPPVGEYEFLVEVIDAYGNLDAQTLSFEVVEATESSADGGVDDGGTDDDSGTGGETSDGSAGTSADDSGTSGSDAGQGLGFESGTSSSCRVGQPRWTPALGLGLMTLGLGCLRRRARS
ncbi:MAG: hypothetical protein K0V04_08655 [Deltaproteobacteria bacterium]|nr:hypothetical protein [Deltaproteobacteria bacterium]